MISSGRVLQLLEPFGELTPQKALDWDGSFELPPEVSAFYLDVGPVDLSIRGYGNSYFIPRLADLWRYQVGYRIDGRNGDRIQDWDDDWLVVADCGADPFIFSRCSGAVSLAWHGEGSWEPRPIFSSILEMSAVLAILGNVVAAAGLSLVDEKGYVLPSCRADALAKLAEATGSTSKAENALVQLGWG